MPRRRYTSDLTDGEWRIFESRLQELRTTNRGRKSVIPKRELVSAIAMDDLRNTRIKAPISGKIGLTKYLAGNYLTPNSGVVATIVKIDPLRVSFAISNKEYLATFGSEEYLKNLSRVQVKLADDSMYEHEGDVEFLDTQSAPTRNLCQ